MLGTYGQMELVDHFAVIMRDGANGKNPLLKQVCDRCCRRRLTIYVSTKLQYYDYCDYYNKHNVVRQALFFENEGGNTS